MCCPPAVIPVTAWSGSFAPGGIEQDPALFAPVDLRLLRQLAADEVDWPALGAKGVRETQYVDEQLTVKERLGGVLVDLVEGVRSAPSSARRRCPERL